MMDPMTAADGGSQGATPTGMRSHLPASPRGQRTRERLVEAAARAFSKYGYAGTNATVIAAEAGVSYGSFYVYFPSKADAFNEVVERMNQRLYTAIRAPKDLPLVDRLRYENEHYFDAYAQDASFWQLMEEVARTDPAVRDRLLELRQEYAGRLARNLARMQEDGELDTAVDAEALAYALGGMAQRLAYVAASDDSLDREALLHALTTVWLRALRRDDPPAPAGRTEEEP